MNGVKFIERELASKCYGNVAVTYSAKRKHLFVEINTDVFFRYHRDITPDLMADKAVLTAIVNSIKLEYISFLLDFYFKTSN